MTTLITNHIEAGKERLREQYKNIPEILALIDSFVGGLQELENSIFDLFTSRTITLGVGYQLDQLGVLLDRSRNGRSDEDYRIILLAKIAQNISRGTPEDVIGVFKLLSKSNKVQLGDGKKGEIYLLADHVLTQDEINFLLSEMNFVDSAGVRIHGIGRFDPDDSFAFNGSDLARGFGSIYDVNKGGKFATLVLGNEIKFAFFGSNPTLGGFGSIYDDMVGGALVAL